MNSRRYCIGFFAGIFLLSLLYIFSDLRFQSAEEGVRAEEGIVYYLEEEEGKVSIYQGEEHTLYEKTSIPVKQLPARRFRVGLLFQASAPYPSAPLSAHRGLLGRR